MVHYGWDQHRKSSLDSDENKRGIEPEKTLCQQQSTISRTFSSFLTITNPLSSFDMSFTADHPPSDLPVQPSPQRSTHTLIFLFEVGSDILISVGIVWPFSERIIVRMNALSHIAVHNVIPLPSRPNCAEQVLTEAFDPLEMLPKAFTVANHEPNSADMLATCFALQCCRG